MLVLSLHEGHNASAAIAADGHIVAAASEERFCRQKNYMGFPYQAAMYCLKTAGCHFSDISKVVMVTRHIDPLVLMINRSTAFSALDHIRQQYDYFGQLQRGFDAIKIRNEYAASCKSFSFPEHYDLSSFDVFSDQLSDSENFFEVRKKTIQTCLQIPEEKIVLADHHQCHAAYAYGAYPLRKEPVLVFTADCIGDGLSATVWKVDANGNAEKIYRSADQLLGYIWRYVTLHLGMIPLEHEYKVMGLAPYGAKHSLEVKSIFDDLSKVIGGKWRRPVRFGHYAEIARKLEGYRFDHIAAGLQAHTEERLSDWIAFWVKQTGIKKVVFSGGLAMNVKASAFIAKQNWIADFFVPPGPGDESLPLGACYLHSGTSQHNWSSFIPLDNAYLGPNCPSPEIQRVLEKATSEGFQVQQFQPELIAKLLADGKVVARCSGRMEFGPRALGNRSILARADQENIREILNNKIKHRDWWMPFAPVIRKNSTQELLSNPKSLNGRYMTLAFETTALGSREVAAAMHPADRSTRAQILEEGSHPALENIMAAYEQQSGKLALVNTSFNLHGEPIVCSVHDAFDTFTRCGLDGLLLPGFLITKKEVWS